MMDADRLIAAYRRVRDDLLAERTAEGYWVGELSSSALSTATAVSALALFARNAGTEHPLRDRWGLLVDTGVRYLAAAQNSDGGWGDTPKSYSNVATTMLARAAFHLAGRAEEHAESLRRAEGYLERCGGVAALRRRYGKDKTFAAPILTNCALAGLVDWREVSPLPFELACLPHAMFRFLRLPVVSYAIPALVTIGQARYHHLPPRNPLVRLVRRLAIPGSLARLQRMQPASGGYLEATPLTSFVVMSLASIDRADHPVALRGVEFLVRSAREDGSWPIDTNLATWVTTLAANALAGAGEKVASLVNLDWLLSCQHRQVHPFTNAAPGGWGWTDLSGAVPDADDTPGALLALAALRKGCPEADRPRIDAAAEEGVRWLLNLQNANGGWPTFCRGWGKLPFDRSATDLTAHAIRALHAWRKALSTSCLPPPTTTGPREPPRSHCKGGRRSLPRGSPLQGELSGRIDVAIDRGFEFLRRQQCPDGSWLPLWFGNQDDPNEENPVYGTARVLLAYRDLERMASEPARRGMAWLVSQQRPDGGWGSVEETAVAVEALLAAPGGEGVGPATEEGMAWLVRAVEAGRHREASPIGFYFAKLWYYERLYPLVFALAALGQAISVRTASESKLAKG